MASESSSRMNSNSFCTVLLTFQALRTSFWPKFRRCWKSKLPISVQKTNSANRKKSDTNTYAKTSVNDPFNFLSMMIAPNTLQKAENNCVAAFLILLVIVKLSRAPRSVMAQIEQIMPRLIFLVTSNRFSSKSRIDKMLRKSKTITWT